MKKYFFNFTNNQIVQQPNYQPTNGTISFLRNDKPFCHFVGNGNPITHFFGTNLIKKTMTRLSPTIKTATATRHKGMLTPSQTIHRFYQAIIEKDAEKITHFYVPDERTYVVLEGPRQATLGFTKIKKGWRDFCDSALSLHSIEWIEDGPLGDSSGDMAWMAGIVNLTVGLRGKVFTRKFRSSFVLRKSEVDGWRIQHEHVSAPMPDPYGIGDWLKK